MAVTYTVRWRTLGSSSWTGEVTGITSTSHAIDGLAAGTRYEVQVVAVSSGGTASTPVQGGRWTVCATPAQPTASDVLAETAGLSWAEVSGAAEYRVVRTPAGGGTPTTVGTVAAPEVPGDLTLAMTGLTEATGYDVTVVAVNADGDESAPSPVLEVTTTPLATGGTVTEGTDAAAGYRIHRFTSSGDFVLNAARQVEYLVVGGGGGGGLNAGGGGGGGAVVQNVGTPVSRSIGTYPVVVGAGGIVAADENDTEARGGPGSTSSVFGVPAAGGGGGGSKAATGGAGASGGGGGHNNTSVSLAGGSGAAGNDGGAGYLNQFGGGGGGAGEPGASASSGGPGRGGDGLPSSITGTEAYYGGGGGGARYTAGAAGAGGRGGGGKGGTTSADTADAGNSGGGGGGGGNLGNAPQPGPGGSGVVIVRYLIAGP